MLGLEYTRLRAITNSAPPYRGTTNRFPLRTRRENTKYFLVRDEGDQKVFDIVYGKTWERSEELEQGKYIGLPNILGTVRPDNSFEFTKNGYHLGENMFFSSASQGWFASDSRRGGMVYFERRGGRNVDLFHPIYKGMRLDTKTMQPLVPYEVVLRHVDRKKSKEVLTKYERFFKVSEVMLKNMTMGMVLDIVRDFEVVGTNPSAATAWYKKLPQDCIAEAEKLIDEAPLDAFALYCVGYNIGRIPYQMRWGSNDEQDSAYEKLFMSLKRKITKEIYKSHESIFKDIKQEQGKRYPSCDWGVRIIVNGEEMEQYA